MLTWLAKQLFHLIGWKIEGAFPHHLDKVILVVLPHTSNWDFPLGILGRKVLRADIKFIGKKSLFRFPVGGLFRWLGGYPVDRSRSHNFVDAVVDIFNREEKFIIAIAPEGTRSPVDHLKSGFYYIAKNAHIHIQLVKFDYEHKIMGFSEPFLPDETYEETLERMVAYFKGVKGKIPENSWKALHSE